MSRYMTPQDVHALVDFHYWARDRMLDAVTVLAPEQFTRGLANSFPSVRDTIVHIYFAEWVWHRRWLGQPAADRPTPDQFPDLASIRGAWREHETLLRGFVDRLGEDVNRPFAYRSLAGEPASSPFSQMLQHVVNHASYHRGQVTTMLRQLGVEPPKSQDLIAFYRERSA